ncbi:MAG: D-isomer specific 2-hydroxyacid dehydrogenase family protein [Spirochaetales bacterium]|nr:D-isomer specific 2-hydroxyacid dehydrogenase family protein [Spirochaetales bacterium]
MKRVIAYAVRQDEKELFKTVAKGYGFLLTLIPDSLNKETASLAQGHDGVVFLGTCPVDSDTLKILSDVGIGFAASRSAGFDNVDLKAAHERGILVSNALYSPNSVAEFAIMSMLSLLRGLPRALKQVQNNDFSLHGLQGREMRNQTVGIVGTGRIGQVVAQGLSGFGCTILGYDPYPSTQAKALLDYVPLDILLSQSDVVSLHVPLSEQTKGMMNSAAFSKMKDGALLINSARGELVNTAHLLQALESGKLGGAALDVLEGERGIFHTDHSQSTIDHQALMALKALPHVQITPHAAFFTQQSVRDMVEASLGNLHAFLTTGTAPNKVSFLEG